MMREVTVTQLMLNFAEACRALVPHLERAGLETSDEKLYDNWDRVVEPLFYTLVIEPCLFHAVGEQGLDRLRIAGYNFEPRPNDNAWIALASAPTAKMIALASCSAPFDHVRCTDVGAVPIDDVQFVFVFEAVDGTSTNLEAVDLDAQ